MFFRSRVARRVFLQFILAAFIPVAVTTLLVVDQTHDTLIDQSHKQLRATSKAVGRSIYERLLFVDRATEETAARLREDRVRLEQIQQSDSAYFRNVTVEINSKQLPTAFSESTGPGTPKMVAEHLASAGAILGWSNAKTKQPILHISRLLDPADPALGMLVAEVNLDYLWGDPESRPFAMELCVLETHSIIVYCSTAWARTIAEQMPAAGAGLANGRFAAKYNDDKFLASYGQIFLAPHYRSPSWTVLVIRAESDILAPIVTFNAILAPVIMLSLLLVMFLSVTQIRKILVPLDKLIRGTRQIAKREFDSKICVTSGDEFEQLATSMNSMSKDLESQFETLQTLSELDRLILSRADIEAVIETVLVRVRQASGYTVGSLTLIDHDSDSDARMFIDNAGSELAIERITLSDKQRQLFSTGAEQLFDARDGHDDLLRPLINLGAQSIFVLPIMSGGRMSAIICLGYRDTTIPSKDIVAQIRDFGDRITVALGAVEHEEQLYRQAHYDPLTLLPNRQLFKDRLQQSIAHAHMEGRKGALLYIDFDRFKVVNDSQGHTVGDTLLMQAASRLQSYVGDADTVARLGGDEFTVVLSNIGNAQMVSRVADELVQLLAKPFKIDNRDQFISASIGVAVFPDDGITVEELLKNADTAMYRAKASGRGRYTFFTEEMNVQAINRHRLESDLHGALEKGQFFLEYQPQVELKSHRVVSAEALVRWQHPDRGTVSPARFVQIAEETGQIESIGKWALQTACEQFRFWQSQNLALERIAVNVSPVQITQSDFVATVRGILADTEMPAHCLELEITENLLLDETGKALRTLQSLHSMGIRIAIDDFGTGYSSMSYLNRFSFDILKIDRSFVTDIVDSEEATAIVHAITAMAQSLRKEVVAEGIETREQAAILGRMFCRYGQGYLFSKPLSAQDFALFVSVRDRQIAS